jgi:hypothetical protein
VAKAIIQKEAKTLVKKRQNKIVEKRRIEAGDARTHRGLYFVKLGLGLNGRFLRLPQTVTHRLDFDTALLCLLLLDRQDALHSFFLLQQHLRQRVKAFCLRLGGAATCASSSSCWTTSSTLILRASAEAAAERSRSAWKAADWSCRASADTSSSFWAMSRRAASIAA